jgi:hypothetical protein
VHCVLLFEIDLENGSVTSSLSVPKDKKVVSINGDDAWVFETDADDVPFLFPLQNHGQVNPQAWCC